MYRHLTMAELLELRDREGGQAARRHLESCHECAAEYERVHQRVAALRALPAVRPPRERWNEVRRIHVAARRRATWRSAGIAGLAAAAVLALVVGLQGVRTPVAPAADARVQLEDLMAESRRLEGLLHTVGQEQRVMNGITAGAIADLEDRIAVLDDGIARATAARYSPNRVGDLWRARVALMGTLVNTHVRNVAYVGY